MSDFPKLEPAFTARLFPKEQLRVGWLPLFRIEPCVVGISR